MPVRRKKGNVRVLVPAEILSAKHMCDAILRGSDVSNVQNSLSELYA